MRKIKIFVGGFFAIALMLMWVPAFADIQVKSGDPAVSMDYKPGQLLVKHQAPVRALVTSYYQEEYGITVIKTFKSGVQLVKLPSDLSVEKALEAYNKNPDVVHAEPNYRYVAEDVIPNDPDFPNARCWADLPKDEALTITFPADDYEYRIKPKNLQPFGQLPEHTINSEFH